MGILQFIDKIAVQTAVYWGSPEPDGYGGYTYDIPVEIAVRWDDVTEKYVNTQGQESVSSAKVMTNAEVEFGGWLFLGELAGMTAAQKANPILVEGAYPIQKIERTPLFRSSTDFVKQIYL